MGPTKKRILAKEKTSMYIKKTLEYNTIAIAIEMVEIHELHGTNV